MFVMGICRDELVLCTSVSSVCISSGWEPLYLSTSLDDCAETGNHRAVCQEILDEINVPIILIAGRELRPFPTGKQFPLRRRKCKVIVAVAIHISPHIIRRKTHIYRTSIDLPQTDPAQGQLSREERWPHSTWPLPTG